MAKKTAQEELENIFLLLYEIVSSLIHILVAEDGWREMSYIQQDNENGENTNGDYYYYYYYQFTFFWRWNSYSANKPIKVNFKI